MISKKGFTLFTALISLLLVSISLALIFNMINTEETYLQLIQDQSSMSDLMTVADIARADAFNSFIITLRSTWEDYKSRDSAQFQMYRKHIDMNWNEFVDDFAKVTFFERNFAGYFARGLLHNLKYTQNPPGYYINIEEKTGLVVNTDGNITIQDELDANTFEQIVVDMFKDGGEKVDIVDCEQDSDSCNGSFFLTLDTTKLSDENYELLPIVTVRKTKTNQVIQRPVLSRQIYKIYIPWRGFQAFRIARRLVIENDAEKKSNPATEYHEGMFSPKIHNTLEQARLGFCDPGICAPRTNFFSFPAKTGVSDSLCNAISNQNIDTSNLPNTLPSILLNLGPYDIYNKEDINSKFTELYKATLQKTLETRNQPITYDPKLEMDGAPFGTEGYNLKISSINVTADPKRTKQHISGIASEFNNIVSSTSFNTLMDISSPAGGLGVFLKDGRSAMVWDIDLEWYNDHKNLSPPRDNAPPEGTLSCSEIEVSKISLVFYETDPRYKVKDSYKDVPKVRIAIDLYDTYTPFFFPPNGSWSGLSTTDGYLNSDSIPTSYTLDQESWTCYSDYAAGGEGNCGPDTS